jgi:peptidoglycan hydrolase-like protein with peptidoglycan-binding domain
MYKFLSTLLLGALLLPVFAFAEEANTTSVKPPCPALVQNVARGASGAGVKGLQEFLAGQYGVDPSTVATGFFGPKTQELVKKFQAEYGLEQVGSVGPKTRAAILARCVQGARGGGALFPATPSSETKKESRGVTCRIHATPVSIKANQPVTFDWTSTGADYAVWGSGDKDNANEMARVFNNISTTTTFSLTFFGQGGSVTCKLKIEVAGTENQDQTIVRPPITSVCPAIGWVEPTSPCEGTWAPRYKDGGCQIGWQCLGKPKEPIQCPQVMPACANPEVSVGADGCKILKCPTIVPTTPPTKPPSTCPMIAFLPAPCSGTLHITKDAQGCQTGFRCEVGSTTPPIIKKPIACPAIWTQPIFSCTGGTKPKYDSNGCQVGIECTDSEVGTQSAGSCKTPWGTKVIADGQTIPYEPYFSNGSLSTTVTIPLVKCIKSTWLLCDALGSNCRSLPPLLQRLDPVGQATEEASFGRSAAELAAAFTALQELVRGAETIFGQ